MLGKKVVSLRKLAKKVKVVGVGAEKEASSYNECLLKENEEEESSNTRRTRTPTGYFAIYVGEERQRYVVPTSYLTHPLFKILLEKSYNEFGFSQSNGLIVPCKVSTFQEVVNAIESNNGKFDLVKIFEDFL